jgi:type IV pilus assembly protein PilM
MTQVVGLDIGTSAVRAAELELGGAAPALVAFGQVGLPPGAIEDGEVQDRSAVADAISRLWENGGFTSRSVVVGIAGLRAITRELDLPWVPDNEVDSAVRFQSEEVIPFPPEKTLLSAQVLADAENPDGTRTRRVLVAAAHRDLVDGVVDVVGRAGLEVQGVDLVSSALVRALVDKGDLGQDPEAIVSVGAGLSVVVVHQQGRPLFVRTIGSGGNAATLAISSGLDVPMVDAEAIKRHLGELGPQTKAAERAVAGSIRDLAGEIRNSIQYFASLPDKAPISRVLITGGGSMLHGLVEALQAQVRIPVTAISPLSRLDLSGVDLTPAQASVIDPVLAAPIGLALPEPNPDVKNFNLVPPEVREQAFNRKVVRRTITVAAAVGALVLGFGAFRFWQVHNAQGNVSSLHESVTQLQAQIPTYDRVVAATNELKSATGQVQGLSGRAVDWGAVLDELGKRTPAGLAVNAFAGTSAGSTSGAAASGSTAGKPVAGAIGAFTATVSGSFPNDAHFSPVALWIDGVSGSPMFSPPGVQSVTNQPQGANTTVSFQSTVSLTSSASIAKNGAH